MFRPSVFLLGALLLGALLLVLGSFVSPTGRALPVDSLNAAESLTTQTPFLIAATLAPTETPTPTITPTPLPTPTPDGPPVPIDDYERLFPGVFYKRETSSSPRQHTTYIVIVDLNKQNIDLMVTPEEGLGHTTSYFLKNYGLQLAINGDGWLGNMDPIGLAASKGEIYSEASGAPTIYIAKNGEVKIGGNPPEKKIWQAISGTNVLVKRGQLNEDIRTCVQQAVYCSHLVPRTSVGISANNYLIIVLVEGPASDPRAALTLKELAELHLELGSFNAIAMDGGGSTTLVVDTGSGPQVLNNPTDGTEREVANHLGIFVRNRNTDD